MEMREQQTRAARAAPPCEGPPSKPSAAGRVAVVGGRGDVGPLGRLGAGVVVFGSTADVGAGDERRLLAALKAGSFASVVLLARWSSHSSTWRLRRACQAAGIRLVVWPSGLSSLAHALAR